MKKHILLIAVHLLTAVLLLAMACNNPAKNKNLQGQWHSKDGKTQLKVTAKQFTIDNNAEIPEDYFVKGDTIFTSFQNNQPYTKFVIQKLDDNQLTLIDPDAELMEFVR